MISKIFGILRSKTVAQFGRLSSSSGIAFRENAVNFAEMKWGNPSRGVRVIRKFGWRLPLFTVMGLAACAPTTTMVSYQKAPAQMAKKSETFGYRSWVSKEVRPDVVVIGIHGFCGASIDYENLGLHLLKNQPKTALYAYEVRGQGSDPIRERRGDIGDPKDWYRDLFAFTQLVEERHPDAKIVWFGESMGGLIAAHAYREAPSDDPPCDALVLSSPVVRFKDDIPAWKPALIQVAAATAPLARVSMKALEGGQEVQMTQTSTHSQQAETNSYHVEEHTLRLLGTLARHINSMNECAAAIRVPVLVLHGENDFFNTDSDVRGFIANIPSGVSQTYRNFPGAYHLLMYDAKKEKVFKEVENWAGKLRKNRF